ncbi:hypothetical protein I551_1952 [Mycobacterium ulcerans str. Harvey]|uniref:Uncharacterized protein n=1 Tax=Mycobacterium ulcerans str. Harvey TaxID=1299332 RepID=A0ABP3AKA9_MYCUL|nr:hypothetical protein I551_1952 [Mycobacterium ulcerans str. Harvey]
MRRKPARRLLDRHRNPLPAGINCENTCFPMVSCYRFNVKIFGND